MLTFMAVVVAVGGAARDLAARENMASGVPLNLSGLNVEGGTVFTF